MQRLPLFRHLAKGVIGLLVLTAACDGGSPPVPTTMTAVAGTNQTATVGTPVSSAPAVKILDENGEPMSGLTVTFSVTGGGGSLSATSGSTDNTGVARAGSWTLGTTAGTNTVVASAQGLSSVTFTATGTAGSPTSMEANSTETQAGVVGAAVGTAPAVLLEDSYGNPVPQVTVTFQVTSGGGSVSGGSATTNASGIATVGSWTLGTTPGTNTLQASYTGLTSINFSATAAADSPDDVAVTSGDGQTATVATQVAVLPTVEVTDQYGNKLEGITVTFAVASGGGTISGGTQSTNSSGRATLGSWTLGTTAGAQSLTATVENVDPATISATAVADDPSTILGASGSTQTGTVGEGVSDLPTVRVEDQFGNGVPGITVTFTETATPSPPQGQDGDGDAPQAGVTGGTATTDANGEASPTSWELGTTAGTYELTATIQFIPVPIVFTATANPGPASVISIQAGNNQSALFGTTLTTAPSVLVTDQYGNPIAGVDVTFAVTAGGGSITGASATTNANGVATLGSWTLGPAPGANTLSATADGVGSVNFTATGTALVPANITKNAGDGQSATVNTAVATAPQVLVTTSGGTPVPNVSVTFAVASGGGSITGGSATTDANGLASVGSWVLGTTAGTNTLTATVSGISPATFSATATAGAPASMAINGGNNQTAQVNTALPVAPSVLIQDQYGNPVSGVTVTFAVTSGGGSVTGGTATTNANGIATVGSWTLGSTVGAQTLGASSAGLTSVSFDATGTAVVGGLNLTVEAVHLNQANQDRTGTIGGIAGRPGLLRVLVNANEANSVTPKVRIILYQGATVIKDVTVSAPSGSVPQTPNLDNQTDTWNVALTGAEVVAGLSVVVMVDPDGLITESSTADNRFPAGAGTHDLDVQTIPTFDLVFIPIDATTNGTTGSITPANESTFLTAIQELLAVNQIATAHHATHTTTHDLSTTTGWGDLLADLQALRTTEAATDQYYHGIVGEFSGIAVGGLGYVPGSSSSTYRSAVSYDRHPFAAGTVAHELGHNLGRPHSPGCGPASPDPNYPYAGGILGTPGYNVRTMTWVGTAGLYDFMSYCSPEWVSDYVFNKLVDWRRSDPLASSPAASRTSGSQGLLVWGSIQDGRVRLNPAFVVNAPPVLPERAGRNRLRGVAADGSEIFNLSFDGVRVADLPGTDARHFSFILPLDGDQLGALRQLEVSAGGDVGIQLSRTAQQAAAGQAVPPTPSLHASRVERDRIRIRWDAETYPMVMVRDARTGEVLSFARGGDVQVAADGRSPDELEILMSDGTRTRRVVPEGR